MENSSRERAEAAAAEARAAEERGDDRDAAESWHRFRLIRDSMRDPDALLADGIALSATAFDLQAQ